MFAGRLTMREVCPACGLRFERESGYFVGAMYVSYALAVPCLFTLFFVLRDIVPGMTEGWAIVSAGIAFLPFVPLVFRTSRVWWLHIDRALDPE